ncbi:VWA domain-containing protein [Paenibacillus dokdonensis]|uniref:VWA domain-containing protein n=1 Tax=Paenibacillus dokdonensis TaxID=2567944 RepID=A0ABU6GMF7_9BACL|nr:VWA domain-containing protein [Paenibacillus dokdonensis]MEC0239426.1 VWA domain-containing protein [Paenibacillus dokdonensis]
MGIGSWLGLWFGLSIPAILAMYLLKRKFLDTKVPSHLLWQRVLKNLEANRPWQKLQNRLLLWLQLLAAALLVFALMKPYLWSSGGGKEHVVLVADTSGSMSAVSMASGQPSQERLEQMKQEMKDYIKQEAKNSDVTLLSMNAEPNLIISREKDHGRATEAIDSLQAYFGKASYNETLSLASALTRDESDAEVVVFTDGQWKGDPSSIPFQAPVKVVTLDSKAGFNLGLQQFGVKDESGGKTAVAVVKNSSKAAKQAEVNLYGDGKLLKTSSAEIKPGASLTLTFRDLPAAEVYRAELEGSDDYQADNEAYAFSQHNETPRILLMTQGNLFLEKGLQLTGAEVVKMALPQEGGTDANPGDTSGTAVPENQPDLIVIDGAAPAFTAQGEWKKLLDQTPVWTLGGNGNKFNVNGGQLRLANHPVNRYVSYNGVYIGSVLDRKLPDWAAPIVSIDNHPAIIAGTEKGEQRLSFLFNLQETDFPLSSEFPIVVHEAVSWLTESGGKSLGRLTAGTRVEIPIAADTVSAHWVAKDGMAREMKVQNLEAEAGDKGINALQQVPPVPGLYAFEQKNSAGKKLEYLAESAADPYEAQWGEPNAKLAAIGQLAKDGKETAATTVSDSVPAKSHSDERQVSLITLLASLALLIILVEWGVYQRGRSI